MKDKGLRELALKDAVEDVKWYLKHYPELREKFGMKAEAQGEVTHGGVVQVKTESDVETRTPAH